AGDAAQDRCLAAAARSEKRIEFAVGNVEGHIAYRLNFFVLGVVGFFQVFNADHSMLWVVINLAVVLALRVIVIANGGLALARSWRCYRQGGHVAHTPWAQTLSMWHKNHILRSA